jgi:D-alanyl-lipoteichoic acid acyltransferase DltB (MBOAT superfamily)
MQQIDFHKLLEEFVYNPKEPMIFSSGFFLFLFLGFMAVYSLVYKHNKLKNIYLTLFSIFFYYKSSGLYFILLIITAIVDYNLAKQIARTEIKQRRTLFLVLSLVVNIGMLIYFKYTNFFLGMLYDLANKPFDPLNIFLPVGISFFTFQSLSYTIDIYRRNIEPVKDISEFAFFVTFFPQMVAGPIVRASVFLPQVRKTPFVTNADFGKAIFLICIGLFKKAVISDYISLNFVDRIFDNPGLYTGLENLLGVYGYALQIYCDFSGYTDMAIGIALMMGYKLPINFDSPYQSASITEFWRRWHISLSSWLRDYLYISLGGNRKGKIRTYFNLMITMLLGGLWHGAALRFVIWGALHGIGLAFEKFINSVVSIPKNKLTRILGVIITFHFVCFAWIYFRADNMAVVKSMLTQITTDFHPEILTDFIKGYPYVLMLMLLGYILHFIPSGIENQAQQLVIKSPFVLKVAYLLVVVFIVIQIKSSEIQPFIYFQF